MAGKKHTVNPNRANIIPIQMRTGWNGQVKFKGLEGLVNQVGMFDVHASWEEEFKEHFGVDVDPARYAVRKEMRGAQAIKHDLREQVKVLMSEFKNPRSVFTIHLVEKKHTIYKKRVPPIKSSSPPRVMNGDVGRNDGGGGMQQKKAAPPVYLAQVRKMTERQAIVESRAMAPPEIVNNLAYKLPSPPRPRPPPPPAPIRRAEPERLNNNLFENNNNYNNNTMYRPPPQIVRSNFSDNTNRVVFHRPTPPPPLPKPVVRYSNNPLPKPMRHLEPPRASGSRQFQYQVHEVMDEDDDEDARSDITSASQDSQVEDLAELGITNEDIKTSFCRKAKSSYSNAQLLKLKHELQTFKRNHNRRWVKWTTTAPITTSILRDLIGI